MWASNLESVVDERRATEPGRREEDWLYFELTRRLAYLEDRIEKTTDKLHKSVEKLDEQIEATEEALHKRVGQLEGYHIEEAAITKTKIAQRTKRLENWQFISLLFGIVGTIFGTYAFFFGG